MAMLKHGGKIDDLARLHLSAFGVDSRPGETVVGSSCFPPETVRA